MKHNITSGITGNCATLSRKDIIITNRKMAIFLPKMFPVFSIWKGGKIELGLFTECDYTQLSAVKRHLIYP